MIGTAFWYVNAGQWRYDAMGADGLASPLGEGRFTGRSMIDTLAQSARSGWMPSFPSLNRNPLTIGEDAKAAGMAPADYVVAQLKSGDLKFAVEDPDAPENWPRVLTVWRANLLGSSSKGNEFFLKHLLGTSNAVRAEETPPEARPQDVAWREESPEGKLDLLVSIDFRMTSTGLFGDVLLPAATWYEKHDLSSTDMHPFVHAFTPAIDPPWETKSDYEIFQALGRGVSALAKGVLDTRTDIVTVPLQHDTPDELAVPGGVVRDWRTGEVDLIPGQTAPKFVAVERDYTAIGAKMSALGPLVEKLGTLTKGVHMDPTPEVAVLARVNGVIPDGPAAGRPSLVTDVNACEAILALSGTTNGRIAVDGFRDMEKRTGMRLADLAEDEQGKRITFADTQARPVPVITSPEWSGSEHGGRRYTAFAINVERLKPWHTLTGRMHFFLDHDWMSELGENLPTFRPPLNMHRIFGDQTSGVGKEVTVRYLTPHSKWSIHSEYQDNLFMLSLSRGAARPLDVPRGRRDHRGQGQRVDRGLQPQRCGRGSGRGVPPDARGHRVHVPRQGPDRGRPAHRDLGPARRHPQLVDPPDDQADAHRRRIRPAELRLQLPGPDRQPARRDHRHPSPRPRSGVLDMLRHGPGRHGDEPRQVHRVPHLLGDLQAGVDQPRRGRVRVVQQRRDPARPGLPPDLPGPGALAGRMGSQARGKLQLRLGFAILPADQDLLQPGPPGDQPVTHEAVDLRVRHPGSFGHPWVGPPPSPDPSR